MADKLKQTVSAFINFVAGERPSPDKFNALVAQTRRGFEAIEYAIGDIHSTGFPYGFGAGSEDTKLTIAYGRKRNLNEKIDNANQWGRPLDIVNLARLIGPASNLNPMIITTGLTEDGISTSVFADENGHAKIMGEACPEGVNQFSLRYPPTTPADVVFLPAGTPFVTFKSTPSGVGAAGDYCVTEEGEVFCFTPTNVGTTEAEYSTTPAAWAGGANYQGATFNVIPDPEQSSKGLSCGITGPLDGKYIVTLPTCTHMAKNYLADNVELDRSNDINSGEQLVLPTWMQIYDGVESTVIPEGTLYLKCVNTNEVFTGAKYEYINQTSFHISNVDLGPAGDPGCGLVYAVMTVGTDITTSIDDVRTKQFQHTHDRTFGEPFVDIYSISGVTTQGDVLTPDGGPYFPGYNYHGGDFAPQYLHRDGFRYLKSGNSLTLVSTNAQHVSSNANAFRGDFVVGLRSGSDEFGRWDRSLQDNAVNTDHSSAISGDITRGIVDGLQNPEGVTWSTEGADRASYVNLYDADGHLHNAESYHIAFGGPSKHYVASTLYSPEADQFLATMEGDIQFPSQVAGQIYQTPYGALILEPVRNAELLGNARFGENEQSGKEFKGGATATMPWLMRQFAMNLEHTNEYSDFIKVRHWHPALWWGNGQAVAELIQDDTLDLGATQIKSDGKLGEALSVLSRKGNGLINLAYAGYHPRYYDHDTGHVGWGNGRLRPWYMSDPSGENGTAPKASFVLNANPPDDGSQFEFAQGVSPNWDQIKQNTLGWCGAWTAPTDIGLIMKSSSKIVLDTWTDRNFTKAAQDQGFGDTSSGIDLNSYGPIALCARDDRYGWRESDADGDDNWEEPSSRQRNNGSISLYADRSIRAWADAGDISIIAKTNRLDTSNNGTNNQIWDTTAPIVGESHYGGGNIDLVAAKGFSLVALGSKGEYRDSYSDVTSMHGLWLSAQQRLNAVNPAFMTSQIHEETYTSNISGDDNVTALENAPLILQGQRGSIHLTTDYWNNKTSDLLGGAKPGDVYQGLYKTSGNRNHPGWNPHSASQILFASIMSKGDSSKYGGPKLGHTFDDSQAWDYYKKAQHRLSFTSAREVVGGSDRHGGTMSFWQTDQTHFQWPGINQLRALATNRGSYLTPQTSFMWVQAETRDNNDAIMVIEDTKDDLEPIQSPFYFRWDSDEKSFKVGFYESPNTGTNSTKKHGNGFHPEERRVNTAIISHSNSVRLGWNKYIWVNFLSKDGFREHPERVRAAGDAGNFTHDEDSDHASGPFDGMDFDDVDGDYYTPMGQIVSNPSAAWFGDGNDFESRFGITGEYTKQKGREDLDFGYTHFGWGGAPNTHSVILAGGSGNKYTQRWYSAHSDAGGKMPFNWDYDEFAVDDAEKIDNIIWKEGFVTYSDSYTGVSIEPFDSDINKRFPGNSGSERGDPIGPRNTVHDNSANTLPGMTPRYTHINYVATVSRFPVIGGSVCYTSGGSDFGEMFTIFDVEEWGDFGKNTFYEWIENLDNKEANIEPFDFPIEEGTVVFVKDNSVRKYPSVDSVPFIVTRRAMVLGNQLTGPYPTIVCSFSGQVPCLVRLDYGDNVYNGDLLIPHSDLDDEKNIGLCRVIRKADATFEDYKLAIGSALNSFKTFRGTEEDPWSEKDKENGMIVMINTAIGHK